MQEKSTLELETSGLSPNAATSSLQQDSKFQSTSREPFFERAAALLGGNTAKDLYDLFANCTSQDRSKFNKLSHEDKAKFIELSSLLQTSGDNSISDKSLSQQSLLALLNLNTTKGEVALTSKDRAGSSSLLDHLHSLATSNADKEAVPDIAAQKGQILNGLISELSKSIDQGKTAYCVSISILESSYLSEPAEIARQVKELVLEGKTTTNHTDKSGSKFTIAASEAFLNQDLKQGGSISALLLATSYMQQTGVTATGMTRAQSENFLELFSGPAVLDALSATKPAHLLSIAERTQLAEPIINARLEDKNSNGKMKEFFVSMQWLMDNQSVSTQKMHSYHNLAVVDYNQSSKEFKVLNPWPTSYDIPKQLQELYGIKKLDGADGEKGYISIPKESMLKLMNWVAYSSNNPKDADLSQDSMISSSETTTYGDLDFYLLKELLDKYNTTKK